MNLIDSAANDAAKAPSNAQAAAGNYRKGHVKFQGLDIAIENARGSMRRGVGADGEPWSVKMPAHYGYIKRTEGADGDHVDVYIGPHHKSPHVFVVDQVDADDGEYDEHKVMLGFGSKKQAQTVYCAGFSDGKGKCRIGHITEMSMDEFKDWLKDEDTTKPVGKFARGGVVKKIKENEKHKRHSWDARSRGPWDRRSRKAGGGAVDDWVTPPADDWVTPTSKTEESGSWIPKAISDVPKEIGAAFTQSAQHLAADKLSGAPGYDPRGRGELGPIEGLMRTGRQIMAVPEMALSPIVGAARSLIGHPMADAEHAVGTIINPKVAAKDDPQKMYEAAKGDVDLAMSAARPKGIISKVPAAPGTVRGPYEISETAPSYQHASQVPPAPIAPEAAANTAAADEFGIKLSKGQATQDLDTIRYEDMAARGAYGKEAQDRAATFFDQQFRDAQAGGQSVGQQTARAAPVVDNPGEAASALNADVGERAARARTLATDAETAAAAEAESQRGIVADQGRALDDTIRGRSLPIENPREAGEIVGQNVRDAAAANRADFRARYDEFGSLPGEFRVDAVRGMGNRVRNELTYGDNPVVIDDLLTPSASRAIQAMDRLSEPRIQNRASPHADPSPGEIAAVSLRGVDQMRKQLVSYYQAARSSGNAADIRATRGVMNGFDAQIERALTEGLFSGDPRALSALQEARASYSRYQRTFTPQGAGDDVGVAMRRIVDRNATPEETANMIIGSGKIGTAGLPVRIADRLEHVLGAGSDSWSAIRQAMWQKASQVRNPDGVINPVKSANNITEFTGSTLAQRMFTAQERAAMRAHAQGVRDLDRVIESLPATERATQARSAYQEVFGGEGLSGPPAAAFRRVVEGVATPEETANAVFKAIGSGNPGNVTRVLQAVERIVGPQSETMAAVRQGVWQKLTQAAAGKDQPGAQKAMQSINEFLNGTGRSIAQQLYSAQELALMDRYQKALKLTIIPKYARTNSDTAPAMLAAVRKYAGMIGSALGVMGHGGAEGGLSGYAVGKLLDKAGDKFLAARQSKKLDDSLNNVVPPPRKPVTPPSTRAAVTRLPLTLRGGPTNNIGAAIARLQGPMPASAEDEKPKP